MALQTQDLLVVQQGGSVYKLSVGTLSDKVLDQLTSDKLPIATASELGAIKVGNNLTIDSNTGVLDAVIPAAMSFKGMIRADATAPTGAPGDLYLFETGGTLDSSWGAIQGQVVQVNDAVVFEESGDWDYLGGIFGVGVTSIAAALPISIDNSNPSTPVISINAATDTDAGSMSASDKDKLNNIQPFADIGTVTEVKVAADSGLTVSNGSTIPVIGLEHATTGAYGSVVLADASALVAGTKGAVTDAEQYKVLTDRLDIVEAIPETVVNGAGAIEVNETPLGTFGVSIKNSSATERGSIQIATSDEVDAAADLIKAVTPKTVADHYLPLDWSKLGNLP